MTDTARRATPAGAPLWVQRERLPPPMNEEPTRFETADGLSLEGRVHVPAAPKGRAIVCHPNPPQGGTMDNKVVVTVTRALAACGLLTLRFNFRGVGGSTGAHSQGQDEHRDVSAALEHADSCWREAGGEAVEPGLRVVCGFSFGSVMASRALSLGELSAGAVDGLLLVGPPLAWRDFEPPPLPWLKLEVIVGDNDSFCPVGSARRFVGDYQDDRARLSVIAGADHMFHGHLGPLACEVYGFVMEAT